MSRKSLYRRIGSRVISIFALTLAVVTCPVAQEKPQLKRPMENSEEKPPEKKVKKQKGPRAVGLLRLDQAGKWTLLPIAILVEGKFYDASAYKADPVPMSLESGTVYEAEQGGESQGLFTVNGALHSKNPGSPNPWVGTGQYLAQGVDAPKSTRKAEDVPVGLDSSGDEPPRLTRGKPAASADSSATTTGAEPTGKSGGTAPQSEGPAKADGGSAEGASGKEAPKETKQPEEKKSGDPNSPEQARAEMKSADNRATGPVGADGTSTDNYYRPTLRRGRPTQPAPAEEETKAGKAGPASAAAKTEIVRFVPGISDDGGPNPESFKFFWKEGEEDERRKQMLTLAASEVRAYLYAREKGFIQARPVAKPGGSKGKSGAKPAEPVLESVQFRAFDVWRNNQAVMIFSAEAHFPTTPGVGGVPEVYNITLVTRTDIYGNPRKLYSGVTDKFHLDVTPRLELIDVVDADGDGRGELLFRETSDAGSGYAIYRATPDRLWRLFESLGAE